MTSASPLYSICGLCSWYNTSYFLFDDNLWLENKVAIDLGSDSLEQLSEDDVSPIDLVADADAVIVEHHFWYQGLSQHLTSENKNIVYILSRYLKSYVLLAKVLEFFFE